MTPLKKTLPFTSKPASNGKPSDQTGFFNIRPAFPEDIGFCYSITTSLAHHYLDDFEQLDLAWIKQLILSGHLYCIDYQSNNQINPVGLIWLANVRLPVSVELHFLLWPHYFRKAHAEGLFFDVIQFVFDTYATSHPLHKIKSVCKSHQSVAIQLLKRLHFQLTGYSEKDTLINGQWIDTLQLEVTQTHWDWQQMLSKQASHKPSKEIPL